MTSFAEALKGLDIQFEENTEVEELTEEQYQAQRDIEMLEKYLKMCERNASEKERFRLAQEYGFLSEKHLKLWLSCNDDYQNQLGELELYSGKALKEQKKKVKELEAMARNIRDCLYYRIMMHRLGQKDFSPYGEDLLRGKSRFDSDTWTVDIEATAKSGYQYIMSYVH